MGEMVRKDIIPAAYTYLKRLSETAVAVKSVCPDLDSVMETNLVRQLHTLTDSLYVSVSKLDEVIAKVPYKSPQLKQACYYRDKVIPIMDDMRKTADEIERFVGEKYWPYPTYGELMFSI